MGTALCYEVQKTEMEIMLVAILRLNSSKIWLLHCPAVMTLDRTKLAWLHYQKMAFPFMAKQVATFTNIK